MASLFEMLFAGLPTVVCVDLFTSWTVLKDLITVDSACTSKSARSYYLDFLATKHSKHLLDDCFGGFELLEWCLIRLVAPEVFCLTVAVESDQIDLSHLFDVLVTLKVLRIKQCAKSALSEIQLDQLLESCSFLVSLDIRSVQVFNNKFLTKTMNKYVLSNCQRFSHTEWDEKDLTSASIKYLAKTCSDLRELDFNGNYKNLGDLTVLIQNNHNLMSIHTSNTIAMKVSALSAIQEGCPGIESIHFELYTNNPARSQSVFIKLVQSCDQLRFCKLNATSFESHLNFQTVRIDCLGNVLTALGLKALIRGLSGVHVLEIGDERCLSIAEGDLTELHSLLEWCDSVKHLAVSMKGAELLSVLINQRYVQHLTVKHIESCSTLIDVLKNNHRIRSICVFDEEFEYDALHEYCLEIADKGRFIHLTVGGNIIQI